MISEQELLAAKDIEIATVIADDDAKMAEIKTLRGAPTPLCQLISELNALGFRVNNLFQLQQPDGTIGPWRANVVLEHAYDFAEGATPFAALQNALAKVSKKPLTNQLTLEDIGL